MSVIPEVIIQRALVDGLRAVRRDPRIIDTLFKNLDQPTVQAIKDSVLKESISFSVNYPREDTLKIPALVLRLMGEIESQTFLGDILGTAPHYDVPDHDLSYDYLDEELEEGNVLGGGHVSGLQGLPRLLAGPLKVSTTRVRPNGDTWVYIDTLTALELPNTCLQLYVTGGSGIGQVLEVSRVTETHIVLRSTPSPQLDASSWVELREGPQAEDRLVSVGEPSRVYNPKDVSLVRKGANYEVNYQLAVIAGQQDQVVYLYTLVKTILFHQKAFMEKNGLMAVKISGADFAPKSEYLPIEAFSRVLNIAFTYPFAFIEELDVVKNIQLCLTPTDPDGTTCCTPLCIEINDLPNQS